ncbi:MAG: TadE/TadG family type IV pilus assembly protein [Rickettsiales bacterium]
MSTNNKTRKFYSDRSGTTAVEFALIAPVFLLMLTGLVEFSLVMFVSSVMEGATAAGSRYGKTGYTIEGITRQQQIVNTVALRTTGLLDPENITVNTTVYPSFESISQEEPYIDSNHNGVYNVGETYTDVNGNGQWDSAGVEGLGNANDVVVYTVSYPWTITTPIINSFFDNPLIISSRTVVKNEPY